jgi:hypothetical protein
MNLISTYSHGEGFLVTVGLRKEPCGLVQWFRLKRWMAMTGKQRVFEVTQRNGFVR